MTRKTNNGLVAWAQALVGQPYWYGTCCYKASTDLLRSKAAQYPSHYGDGRMARYREHIRNKATVQDCIGLIKGYYWTRDNGTQKYGLDGRPDKGANGMFAAARKKGPIGEIPEVPGLLLYAPGHAGVYIGEGWGVEAKGFRDGVVRTAVASRTWTHWYECPYIEYEQATAPEALPVLSYAEGETMPRGEAVRKLQQRLSDLGYSPGRVDGIFGPRTRLAVRAFQQVCDLAVDGVVRRDTWIALGLEPEDRPGNG